MDTSSDSVVQSETGVMLKSPCSCDLVGDTVVKEEVPVPVDEPKEQTAGPRPVQMHWARDIICKQFISDVEAKCHELEQLCVHVVCLVVAGDQVQMCGTTPAHSYLQLNPHIPLQFKQHTKQPHSTAADVQFSDSKDQESIQYKVDDWSVHGADVDDPPDPGRVNSDHDMEGYYTMHTVDATQPLTSKTTTLPKKQPKSKRKKRIKKTVSTPKKKHKVCDQDNVAQNSIQTKLASSMIENADNVSLVKNETDESFILGHPANDTSDVSLDNLYHNLDKDNNMPKNCSSSTTSADDAEIHENKDDEKAEDTPPKPTKRKARKEPQYQLRVRIKKFEVPAKPEASKAEIKYQKYRSRRAKLMDDPEAYQKFKEMDALRAKKYRQEIKNKQEKFDSYRELARLRMRRLRQKWNEEGPERRKERLKNSKNNGKGLAVGEEVDSEKEREKLRAKWRETKALSRKKMSAEKLNMMNEKRRQRYRDAKLKTHAQRNLF